MGKKSAVWIVLGLLFIAGILDIKYRGLFFRMLPCRIQHKLTEVFQHEDCRCSCGHSQK
ncbi:hypothetical protein [Virgibacillus siamensis]|uniref:hypothetical protein n=1 Tax=Virgibacillus siamensis TaxID=480071 RepID=UPI00158E9987|nr:hypothetical protein [Virgibacillus siamensis]